MSESLTSYLYRKTKDKRLTLESPYKKRFIETSLYLAKINNQKIIYLSDRSGYMLPTKEFFYFKWEADD